MSNALTDRQTERRERGLMRVPVAAATQVLNGTIACVDVTGHAVAGATRSDLIYLGRFEEGQDNRLGAAGERQVLIRTNALDGFLWDNSTTDPVQQLHLGMECWIQDNQTVAATHGDGTRSKAGRVVGFEGKGVWVE